MIAPSLESLHRLTPLIAPSNNESRLVALGMLPPSSAQTCSTRASELITALDNGGAYTLVQPPDIRVMWQMLKEYTDRGVLERYDKGFRRTPKGDTVCAIGGALLDICISTAVPTRKIIGQSPDMTHRRDPVATRIIGWKGILGEHAGRILNTDMLKVLEQLGMTSRGAASALKDFVDDGILLRDYDHHQPHCAKLGFNIEKPETDISPDYRLAGLGYMVLVQDMDEGLGAVMSRNRRLLGEITDGLIADEMLGDLFQVSASDNPFVQNDGRRAKRTKTDAIAIIDV